ncbi:unnamed protein product, partial [Staurois parvus]
AQQCHPSVPSSVTCQCCPAVPPVSAQQLPLISAHHCCISVHHQCLLVNAPPVPPHQCYLSVLPHQCPSVLPISAASPTHQSKKKYYLFAKF